VSLDALQNSAVPPGLTFGEYYYKHDCGIPYERNIHWTRFFGVIADRIVSDLKPTTALDAGCAIGMLVEALRDRGVDAYGVDVSDWAIENTPAELRPFCRLASLTEPIDGWYDIITCIEVIEHIPPPDDATVLKNLCGATDRLLLSSSPHDYSEPTHVNVRPPEDWAVALARHGFVRDLDFDASFVTPWAALYVRTDASLPEIVRGFERRLFYAQEEITQLRSRVLEIQRELEAQFDNSTEVSTDETTALREEILATRDELIGASTQLGLALGTVQELENELSRYQSAIADINGFRHTPIWFGFGVYVRLRRRLGTLVRRLANLLR